MLTIGPEILKILREKNIHHLYHFTQTGNIESILQNGLMSRNEQETYLSLEEQSRVCVNDGMRLDGCMDATSVSIEFPNYKMFYSLRMDPENKNIDWVVLRINAYILCEIPCAFCWGNAANNLISTQLNDKAQRKELETPEALRGMFENRNGDPERDLYIPDNYPTNPQAEVLVFGRIPVEAIECFYFENQAIENKYTKLTHEYSIETSVNANFFGYRPDWRNWI